MPASLRRHLHRHRPARYSREFWVPIAYPTIIGHESIGRVVEVGNRSRNYKAGDLITAGGRPRIPRAACQLGRHGPVWRGPGPQGHAGRTGLTVPSGIVFRVNQVIPEGLIDPLDATMIITWRETLSYVTRMGIGKGAEGAGIRFRGQRLFHRPAVVEPGAESVSFLGSKPAGETACSGWASPIHRLPGPAGGPGVF